MTVFYTSRETSLRCIIYTGNTRMAGTAATGYVRLTDFLNADDRSMLQFKDVTVQALAAGCRTPSPPHPYSYPVIR